MRIVCPESPWHDWILTREHLIDPFSQVYACGHIRAMPWMRAQVRTLYGESSNLPQCLKKCLVGRWRRLRFGWDGWQF